MQSTFISVVAIALQCISDQKFLIARRGPGQSGVGEWEFPGGKVEAGETQWQALIREIEEELGLVIKAEDLYYRDTIIHQYPQKLIELNLWVLQTTTKPELKLVDHDLTAWINLREIGNYQMSQGDRKLIKSLF